MSKKYKITYAVQDDKTTVIVINETNTVADVLDKIQKKECDEEYTHLFINDTEINSDEILFDYYDPREIFIASKTGLIPDDLYTTEKAVSTIKIDKEAIGDTIFSDSGFKPPDPPMINPKIKKRSKFTVHVSLTLESMLNGNSIEGIDTSMDVDKVKNVVLDWIKEENSFKNVLKNLDDADNIEVYLYLPSGAPFLSGTYSDWENSLEEPVSKLLYVVVTRKLGSLSEKIIENVCDCSTKKMKLILSPLFNSKPEGYTQIASLLGYFYYGGTLPSTENLLRNISTMTGFAPLTNILNKIMVQKKVNGMMVASITAPLHTFIRDKVVDSNNETAFLYAISVMDFMTILRIHSDDNDEVNEEEADDDMNKNKNEEEDDDDKKEDEMYVTNTQVKHKLIDSSDENDDNDVYEDKKLKDKDKSRGKYKDKKKNKEEEEDLKKDKDEKRKNKDKSRGKNKDKKKHKEEDEEEDQKEDKDEKRKDKNKSKGKNKDKKKYKEKDEEEDQKEDKDEKSKNKDKKKNKEEEDDQKEDKEEEVNENDDEMFLTIQTDAKMKHKLIDSSDENDDIGVYEDKKCKDKDKRREEIKMKIFNLLKKL